MTIEGSTIVERMVRTTRIATHNFDTVDMVELQLYRASKLYQL